MNAIIKINYFNIDLSDFGIKLYIQNVTKLCYNHKPTETRLFFEQ